MIIHIPQAFLYEISEPARHSVPSLCIGFDGVKVEFGGAPFRDDHSKSLAWVYVNWPLTPNYLKDLDTNVCVISYGNPHVFPCPSLRLFKHSATATQKLCQRVSIMDWEKMRKLVDVGDWFKRITIPKSTT
jgi:hypothetical protein